MSINNLLLPGFTESLYDAWANTMHGPVNQLSILDGGTAYSNGDTVVFTRNASDTETSNAVATIVTTPAGIIDAFDVVANGMYSIVPAVSVSSNTGAGANLYCTIAADSYYVFAAGVELFSDEPAPDPVSATIDNTVIESHRQMLFGDKVDHDSVSMVVPVNTWTTGTVYPQYDDGDPNLLNEMFYVVNSSGLVYKCVNNAQGQPSTVQPTTSQPLAYPPVLADGYQWMYLYTLPVGFSSTTMMPVIQEANTANAAVPGAIYSVKVISSGLNYPGSSGTIVSTGANGATSIYLSTPPSIYTNYYQGCYLTVWGAGGIVNNFIILRSTSAGSYQQVNIAGSFNANQISAGYQYQIGPAVQVLGDGSGFSGYADVSPVNGGITNVHVLNSGNGYHYANTTVLASMFGANASLSAIIGPLGGHGSDVVAELFADTISVTGKFSNTDSNFASMIANTSLKYRTIGLLKNPLAYGSNLVFTGESFNQRVVFNFPVQLTPFFTPGEILAGSAGKGQVVVDSANGAAGVVEVTGWNGSNIQAGETVTGLSSGTVLVLGSVTGTPTLQPFTGEVIYLSNFTTITHSNTNPSDSFQILISQ